MTNRVATAPAGAAGIGRQAGVATALVGTVTINALANILPLNGQSTGEISDRFPLLVTPPGYVFGIWSLIYTGLLAYAVYQALPAQRDNERLQRIAWPFVASCAANALWIVLWHYNQYALTLPIMVGLLLALILIDIRLGHGRFVPLAERLFVRAPFSIYLGWISVATIVNATVVLYNAGWRVDGFTAEVWTSALIAVGAALGIWQGAGRGSIAYPLVLAWAFSGIAIKNAALPLVSGVAWTATVLMLVAASAAVFRSFQRGRV